MNFMKTVGLRDKNMKLINVNAEIAVLDLETGDIIDSYEDYHISNTYEHMSQALDVAYNRYVFLSDDWFVIGNTLQQSVDLEDGRVEGFYLTSPSTDYGVPINFTITLDITIEAHYEPDEDELRKLVEAD